MTNKITIINGPNLNLLGSREPEIYGNKTLDDVFNLCKQEVSSFGFEVDLFQSNHEGEIIDFIQSVKSVGIVANLGAYTHTSIAIYDALKFFKQDSLKKLIEVHISNVHSREEFRGSSYISKISDAVICGLGIHGYVYACKWIAENQI